MIARIWRGWAPQERADDYQRHYETEVSEHLRAVVEPAAQSALTRWDERVAHHEVTFDLPRHHSARPARAPRWSAPTDQSSSSDRRFT